MLEELDQDIRDHIERETQDNIARGMSPKEARYAALRKFGNVTRVKEETREVWSVIWLEQLLQDIRFGLRMLRKSPGFTAAAVLTLALGIGPNIAMFSIADAVALRPLAVEDTARIVRISNTKVSGAFDADPSSSWPEYEAFRTANRSLSGIAASDRRRVLLRRGEEARLLLANVVSPNYFDVLRVKPILGRVFGEGEFQVPDAPHVIVFSYDFWQREFNRDPRIVGTTVIANQLECLVIGILPRSYRGTEHMLNPDVYVPLPTWYAMDSNERKYYAARDFREFDLFGKLQSGATPGQAQVELAGIQQRLSEQFPKTDADRLIAVKLDREQRGEQVGPVAALLFCVTGLVLLIACANVTNLLLARGEARRKEIATRIAVGAGRFRLVRQLLTETLVLACMAAVFAYLLATWIIHVFPSLMPPGPFPLGFDFRMDTRTVAFAVVISIVTVFLAGLTPAFGSIRTSIAAATREQAVASGKSPGRLKNVLVVAEVAISAMLLIASGLLIRTLVAVRSQDLGFDQARKMLIVTFDTSGDTDAQYQMFLHQVLERLPATPGVESVALAGRIPMWESGGGANKVVWIPGLQTAPGDDGVRVGYTVVSPGYFSTMGTRILLGRAIDGRDIQTSKPVAVVNENCARRLWPGQDPIGQHFRVGGSQGRDVEVVGIAQDGHYNEAVEDQRPYLFLPMFQESYGDAVLLVSTKVDPRSMVGSVRQELHSIDRNALVLATMTMDEHMQYALFENRLLVKLVTSVGVLGLVLAAVGLYGVISYSVSRRTHEIGVRIALGAERWDILRLVIARGGRLALIGVGIGLVAALGVSRVMTNLLFGVGPTDPLTFTVVSAVLFFVALMACYIPARRATRVDPIVALRYE
jgi:putative ABC transport system permease protein